MNNVYWLEPGRLGGRAGPLREPWDLAQLLACGIDAVLNVSETSPDYAAFADAGIHVAWVPLPNTVPPTADDEAVCMRMLRLAYEFVAQHLNEEHTVIVHCAWGRDRTGMVLAYHLVVRQGLTPSEAMARIRRCNPKACSAPGWDEMTQRVLHALVLQDAAR